tara:strand:- start:4196 stop:5320 length:1125 start_codon:yes stop_codon:yes gene_type:complete
MNTSKTTQAAEPDDVHRVFYGIRRSLAILTTIAVLAAFYFAKDLIMPVLIGALLALTLSPVSRFLVRLGLPHFVSAILLVLVTAVSVATIMVFSAATVNSWVSDAPELGRELRDKLSGVSDTIEVVRDASKEVEDIASDANGAGAQEVIIRQPSLLDNALSTVTSLAGTFAVALVLATFLLASGDMFYIKIVQSFKSMSGKKRALTAVYDIERKVSRYLFTITLINAGLGVAIALTVGALGLEYAYIWGIAAFLLNFVPYLGGIIGSLLIGAYSIVYFDSLSYALLVPISYQALTGIEGQVITPMLVGKRLEVNAVAVFLTVVLWGWLWGIPGALVAVPFLVVFKVICENFEDLENFANFLGTSDDVVKAKVSS